MSDQPQKIDFWRVAADNQRKYDCMERLGLLDLALDEAMTGWVLEDGQQVSGTFIGYLQKGASSGPDIRETP